MPAERPAMAEIRETLRATREALEREPVARPIQESAARPWSPQDTGRTLATHERLPVPQAAANAEPPRAATPAKRLLPWHLILPLLLSFIVGVLLALI